MIKKNFAFLAVFLFFVAIITSACGGGGKSDPPSYPFIPVPTPTPTVSPTPEPTPIPIPTPIVSPTSESYTLELSNIKFTLNVGATDNVTVTLNGEDVTDSVTYTVDEEAIARVEGGLITGVSAGVAIVTVHSDNAVSDAIFVVNVIDPGLPSLEVEPTEVNLTVGEESTVTVTLEGKTVTEDVTYTVAVDDESIVSVDKGTVSGLSEGSAIVTVSLENANSTVFTVNVTGVNPFLGKDVGDIVPMGSYPQTASGEVQPIEWRVLHKENNRLLVVSEKVLDAMMFDPYDYNTNSYSNDWASSKICSWLNSYFYNTAFSNSEKGFIYSTELSDVDETGGTYNVFLLSKKEAEDYFADNSAQMCKATEYAKANGVSISTSGSYAGNCSWWLRSPDPNNFGNVYFVDIDGSIFYCIINGSNAVRPALWINL